MATLKSLVKKYSIDSKFDYDTFEENTGVSKNDQVRMQDLLFGFEETVESLERCYNRGDNTDNEMSKILPFFLIGMLLILSRR